MPDLRLYTSNRLEVLAEKLAEVLSKPLASPLQQEIILVHSKGSERRVSMDPEGPFPACALIDIHPQGPYNRTAMMEIFRNRKTRG